MVKQFSIEERLWYLKEYGSFCMAFSTLQPGMRYVDLPGVGYLAYMKNGKTRVVLGDPICAEGDRERLIRAALKEYSKTSFYQISKSTAELLHRKFGFYMNIFGTEALMEKSKIWTLESTEEKNKEIRDIEKQISFLTEEKNKLYEIMGPNEELRKEFWRLKREIQALKGKSERIKADLIKMNNPLVNYLKKPESYHIRRQYNSALNEGIEIFEERINENNRKEIEEISREWITTKKVSSNEMKFFTRPLTLDFDSRTEVRLFTAKDKTGKLLGFLILDPLYAHQEVIGYFPDILRLKKNIAAGTGYLLLIAAMDSVFNEGYELYNLGLSPFHKVSKVFFRRLENPDLKKRVDNLMMTSIFRNFFKYGHFFYNTKSQAFHKERFGGEMKRTFCATRKKFPVEEILEGFKISNIDLMKQIKKVMKS